MRSQHKEMLEFSCVPENLTRVTRVQSLTISHVQEMVRWLNLIYRAFFYCCFNFGHDTA